MRFDKYQSLVDVLNARQEIQGVGITFIRGEQEERFVSYHELHRKALQLLFRLENMGIRPGQELILQLDDHEHFVSAFWASIMGKIVPVPITAGNNDEQRNKLFRIWGILNAPNLIVEESVLEALEKFSAEQGLEEIMKQIRTRCILWEDLPTSAPLGIPKGSQPKDTAFIQFSSGSTGDPKGVVLTHQNLLTNCTAIIRSANVTSQDSTLSWMPLTHDMGLIGFHMVPTVAGLNQFNIPTSLFIRRPILWMDKAHEHKGTLLSSPNFGLKYFLTFLQRTVTYDWDLSDVRLIFNGAEPISRELCLEFLEAMGRYGLKRNTLFPVYGMAEASLAVSFPPLGEELVFWNLHRNFLNTGQTVLETQEDDRSVPFVDVGYPVHDCHVRICNEEKQELGGKTIGYIQIQGGNVTEGYYNSPEASIQAKTMDGWLNTGDLGFMHNGRLVITGRAKDVICINGQNYYPQDIERVISTNDGIDLREVVACGVFDNELQTEGLYLFVLFKKKLDEFIPLQAEIRRQVTSKLGLEVAHVIPVRKMPKTTSGKIQRFKLAEGYLNGAFAEVCQEIDKLLESVNNRYKKSRESISQIEACLLEICREIFHNAELGIYDNLIECGGNSLLLTQIQARLEQYYPGIVSVTDLFSYPTIAKLACHIGEQGTPPWKPIRLPADYFNLSQLATSGNSRTFCFNNELVARMRATTEIEGISLSVMLISLYLYLFSEVSREKIIAVPVFMNGEFLMAEADFATVYDFSSLSRMVKQCLSHKTHKLFKINEQQLQKGLGEMIPCFVYDHSYALTSEILENFDLLLEMRELDDTVHLLWTCRGSRLREDKAGALFGYYLQLIQMLVAKYASRGRIAL